MSDIRVTHSGFINLFTGLARVAAAFVFITLITRNLTVEEFGQYSLVLSVTVYFITSHWIISYWVTREIARGFSSGKTAILSSGLFSSVGYFLFILIATLVLDIPNLDFSTILLAGILIPLQLSQNVLTHIATGWKPQFASYGNLVLELSRVPLVFVFLMILKMELNGVFISLILSFIVSNVFLLYCNRSQLHTKFSLSILKNWLTRFWISGYPSLISIIYTFDFLIVAILASPEIVGFYAAVLAIGSFVSHSKLVTVGVYPKLLGKDRGAYLNENFRLLLYFALLFSTLSIVFAKAGLFVLNPAYQTVSIGVFFISLRYFLFSIYDNFNLMLRATETIDEKINPMIKDFLTSKLFKLPTIQLIQYVSYILILSFSLIFIEFSTTFDLIFYWSVISLLTQIPSLVIISIWIKKERLIQVKPFTILKYFASLIPVYFLVDFLNNNFLNYGANFFEFVLNVILILIVGIIAYIVITFIVDSNTRLILKSILFEIKK